MTAAIASLARAFDLHATGSLEEAAGIVIPIADAVAMFEAQRLRRDRRWCAEWHGRFMPALVARLDVQTPYR